MAAILHAVYPAPRHAGGLAFSLGFNPFSHPPGQLGSGCQTGTILSARGCFNEAHTNHN